MLFVLAGSPFTADYRSLVRLAGAAQAAGHEVSVFCLAEGIYALNQPDLVAFNVAYCGHNAAQRGWKEGEGSGQRQSLPELAELISEADRCLFFPGT